MTNFDKLIEIMGYNALAASFLKASLEMPAGIKELGHDGVVKVSKVIDALEGCVNTSGKMLYVMGHEAFAPMVLESFLTASANMCRDVEGLLRDCTNKIPFFQEDFSPISFEKLKSNSGEMMDILQNLLKKDTKDD